MRTIWALSALVLTVSGSLVMFAGSTNSKGPVSAKVGSLLSQLGGARTPAGDLVINELHGRLGRLYLGMSISAAKNVMPPANFWLSQIPGEDLTYCSRPSGSSCTGPISITITSYCERWATLACDEQNVAGPVAEIDLSAGTNPLKSSAIRDAVTLRGVRIGSPTSEISRKYKVTDIGDVLCGGATPPPGSTYVALAGKNTIAITSNHGVVYTIALIAGRHPHLCRG